MIQHATGAGGWNCQVDIVATGGPHHGAPCGWEGDNHAKVADLLENRHRRPGLTNARSRSSAPAAPIKCRDGEASDEDSR